MPSNSLCVRGVLFAACAVANIGIEKMIPYLVPEEDQRRLCTPDAFRLCSSEIPDRERVIACMRRQRHNLSPECRAVFGKPAQSASAVREN